MGVRSLTSSPGPLASNREFRLRQRQSQKAVILFVKRGKNDRAVRVARIFFDISLPCSSKLLREMTKGAFD